MLRKALLKAGSRVRGEAHGGAGGDFTTYPGLRIGKAGFRIDKIDAGYVAGMPKIAGFATAGVASR